MGGVGCFLVVLAAIVATVGSIMVLVAAFRVSLGWGLAVLFIPFAGLVFVVKYWEQAKLGFLISVGGNLAVFVVAFATGLAASLPGMRGQEEEMLGPEGTGLSGRASVDRPTPTPPPAPAPSPTAYLPAPLLGYTPKARPKAPMPSPEEDRRSFVLTVDNAYQRLGWTMSVTTADGREFEGVLVDANERSLTFQRQLGGGSMIFPIPKGDIRKLELVQ